MSEPMTEQEIEEARALADAATPGPWKHGQWKYDASATGLVYTHVAPRDGDDISIVRDTPLGAPQEYVINGCGCCGSPSGSAADAAFIAASRTLVPRLLAEFVRLRAELGHVEPAEEPNKPLRLLIDRRCECCGRMLRAGELVAGFGGDEDDAPQAVMHWSSCTEPLDPPEPVCLAPGCDGRCGLRRPTPDGPIRRAGGRRG